MRKVGAESESPGELALIGTAFEGIKGNGFATEVCELLWASGGRSWFAPCIARLDVGNPEAAEGSGAVTLGLKSPARSASVHPPGSVGDSEFAEVLRGSIRR
jgi:hypothetical protein